MMNDLFVVFLALILCGGLFGLAFLSSLSDIIN